MHCYYDRRTGTFSDHRLHWDWRYRITIADVTVYDRRGFCSWHAAVDSLRRAWVRVEAAIADERRD
jgi:hypothetical protein